MVIFIEFLKMRLTRLVLYFFVFVLCSIEIVYSNVFGVFSWPMIIGLALAYFIFAVSSVIPMIKLYFEHLFRAESFPMFKHNIDLIHRHPKIEEAAFLIYLFDVLMLLKYLCL